MQDQDPSQIMNEQLSKKYFQCTNVAIQNLQRNKISKSMIEQFLINSNLVQKIKEFTIDSKNGLVKIDFNSQPEAEDFYYEHNFQSKIMNRPMNIYFDVKLDKQFTQRLYIHGVTNKNQRQIFEILQNQGPVKVYTDYSSPFKQDVKPSAMISFIRSKPFTIQQIAALKDRLKTIEVRLEPYYEKSVCSIKLFNFFNRNFGEKLYQDEEIELNNFIIKQYKDIFLTNPKKISFHVDCGRVQAIIDFCDQDQTIRNFQRLRDQLVLRENQEKATLFMHEKQYNSFHVLFTNWLQKPQEDISDKKFQKMLLNAFRKVNQEIVHVWVTSTKAIGYIAKVYFKDQEDGKNFMSEYTQKRKQIVKFFVDKNRVSFNFNLDNQHLRKNRTVQVRGNQIIYNFTQQKEKEKRAIAFQKKAFRQNQNTFDNNSNYYQSSRNQQATQPKPVKRQFYKPRQVFKKQQQSFPELYKKQEQSIQVQESQSFPEINPKITQTASFISETSSIGQDQFKLYTFDRSLFQQKQDFIQWLESQGVQSKDFKGIKFRTNVKTKKKFGQIQLTGRAFKKCNKKKLSFNEIQFKLI